MSETYIKQIEEKIKKQGCKPSKCGIIENNTKLRCKVLEQAKIIELMAEYISIQKWGNAVSKETIINYFQKEARGDKQC